MIHLEYPSSKKDEAVGHANAFLVDLKDVDAKTGQRIITVEIFEPNGTIITQKWFDHDQYIAALRNLFQNTLGATHMFEPGEFCPNISFQELQGGEIDEALESDPGGFCQAWSLWWIEFRLKNAESTKTRQELVKMAIDQLKQQKGKKSLTKFIRNYGEFIVRQRNKILEDAYNEIGKLEQGKKEIETYEAAMKQRGILENKKKRCKIDIGVFKLLLEEKQKENDTWAVKYYEKEVAKATKTQKETEEALENLSSIYRKIEIFFKNFMAFQLDKVVRELHNNNN